MEKITFDANENQNRAGVDILMKKYTSTSKL